MDTTALDRLTLLERAQALHNATLLHHGGQLAQHQDTLARLTALAERQQTLQADVHALMAGLLQRQDDQTARLERHAARMALLEDIAVRLQQTLDAIKDMLDRGNGH